MLLVTAQTAFISVSSTLESNVFMPYHYVESIQRELEMITLKVTSKGQVTLKQDLLKHLGVRPGQKIQLKKTPHGGITVKAALKQEEIVSFIGCLAQQPTTTLSIDEMNAIAAEAWAEQN